ncbi:DUF6706 family protein [Gaoshiqia sediminis]|uniref:Uncharacterized protein n=1 Tax=Gaoshiqia sediminis TaxID=2986998 RepID=A0AA41YCT0_9BACT|nr:DUF6706 family protein [Gaoshiqia sediminis]MCW0484060.1 hypothetical protein [Gaoshiqia sediminis]
MTVLEAIKSTVAGYPLSDDTFNRVLIDRGLSATAEYAGTSKEFELAKADILMVLVSAAGITEGGFQISVTDKSNFIKMANAIYTKYDDPAAKVITVPRGRAQQRW